MRKSSIKGKLNLSTRTELELLVIQPTAFCNLDCRYCYVPERTNPARISNQTLSKLCIALSNAGRIKNQSHIEVLWHAGEPLAAGLPFYQEARAIFNEKLGTKPEVRQTFQTNATLINRAWCEYFIESNSLVGISLDGPKEIHNSQRFSRSKRGSFDKVMQGVALLRNHDIPINALCVLTPVSLQQPDRIFDFFSSNNILNIAFNVEETEGEHLVSALKDKSTVRNDYLAFMLRFLELNLDHGCLLKIREFQAQSQYLWNRAHDRSFCPDEAENSVGRIITVSCKGEVFSWSPELASGAHGNVAFFSLGNINEVGSLDELIDCPKASRIQSEINSGIDKCKKTCKYFNVCGGGSPANKFYENGSFDSTETLRCRLQTQALTDLILEQSGR
jgi:uncharacterized protein